MDNRQQYQLQNYIDMLLEESERLYNKLVKEMADEIISDYDCIPISLCFLTNACKQIIPHIQIEMFGSEIFAY